jgi:NAD(P)H-quinone oxidoreductase subunit 5
MVTYALIYKGITALMSDMPMVVVPLSLSVIEIAFGILFLAGFFYNEVRYLPQYPWLYAKLLNISQPYKKTVLMYKSKSL